jgi:hypothetical protein
VFAGPEDIKRIPMDVNEEDSDGCERISPLGKYSLLEREAAPAREK